ncbi:MAG TPA: Re/Si-specific NAD(P)(+) transhydrogenase subunit alpha [Pyrinomonadaceae bacterium]|nr:Re/Si-specific NAD(P)(+) transhydrogenase subunit alpha [Pyrinomonadaceae bacterium]
MQVFIPREDARVESRVPVVPATAGRLVRLGAQVLVESALGASIGHTDEEYSASGALVSADRNGSLSAADIVLRLRKPPLEELRLMKPGSIHVSYLDPFNEPDLIQEAAASGISAISMEMIPRTTVAQKMDALSSQANLAGYVAVILAAERLDRIFPMMMTPAGTISPARVFIIGAGVAGLQAIATAKRLGARVEAFDTRPVVEEQVRSLGAKFIKIDLGETGQTEQGYAKALGEEQLQRQREAMARHCAQADVVITTAQVFGKRAPLIITAEMLKGMKPGSIIVDLAVETGGNVEGSKLDEEVFVGGVRVIGLSNLPGRVAVHASQMYSNNLGNLIEHFWDKEAKRLRLDPEDEILKACLITYDQRIQHEIIRNLIEQGVSR